MKYIILILLFVAPIFVKAHICDTVPSGVPQLFGGKYYKYNGYILIDSFIMNTAGDTNLIPYYPSLKFKLSDKRWYSYDLNKWHRLFWDNDTANVLATKHDINNLNIIDVFLVAGQSNAVGQGDSTLSPKVISGKVLQINSGVITDANDPVGQDIGGTANRAHYGSAWPAFGNTYYNRTSRMICFVPSSEDGTSQCAAADVGNGNWDSTGVLVDSAFARVNSAMNRLRSNGYNPVFKGVMWLQGESDAIAIETGTITQANYLTSFRKMLTRFRQNYGVSMPFNIIRIGTSTTHPDTYWQQIRDAQQTVANTDSATQIIYYNAANFITRGLMIDNIHYNQVGLNEVGRLSALAVTAHIKNIWQPQTSTLWYPQTIGIGGAPVSGMDIEVIANASGNRGLKLLNASTVSSSTAMVRFDNDAGTNGFLWSTSTNGANNVSGARTIVLYSGQSGGLRLVTAGGGDMVFSKFASLSAGSFGRFVNSTGDYLYNTETDNTSFGKFQVNSTSWFNGLMKIHSVPPPVSTYNLLVHGLTDSATYQISPSGFRGYSLYTSLLLQSDTSNPVATVLKNELSGTIVWARTGTGIYTGTLTGAFPAGKTFIVNGENVDSVNVKCFRTNNNTITVKAYQISTGTLVDVFTDLAIEIKVYP